MTANINEREVCPDPAGCLKYGCNQFGDGSLCHRHPIVSGLASTSAALVSATSDASALVAWQPLTEGERAQAVAAICEYGTGFVAPLFATIEGIERKLQERNALAAQPPHLEAAQPERETFDLTGARELVLSAIRRMRAAHVDCLDLTMQAEMFLEATHAAAKPDELWNQTLTERDRNSDAADRLANGIAKHLGIDIGEHSSANDPWANAIEAIEQEAAQGQASATEPVGAAMDALRRILKCDTDAKRARGNPRANLNGVGLVDMFDSVGHIMGVGPHKLQPYRSAELDAALTNAYAALTPPAATALQQASASPCLNELVDSMRQAAQTPGQVSGAVDATAGESWSTQGEQHSWFSRAAVDVTAERRRQIEVEGWIPEHDDNEHDFGSLARAAACYALGRSTIRAPHSADVILWPWDIASWKPSNDRRNLVKAGALILAEIERIDRATTPDAQPAGEGT